MALSTEELKGIYVGQTLCLTEIDNRNRYNTVTPKEATVTKVGKKYFYVQGYNELRFHLDSGRQENGGYSPRYELFFDEATYNSETEANEVWTEYRKIAQHMYSKPKHVTVDQVRQLISILTTPINNN